LIVRNAQAVPPELNRYELKVDGPLYLDVIRALPDEMASSLRASVKSAAPSNTAIKQHFASGKTVECVEVKRQYHLRVGNAIQAPQLRSSHQAFIKVQDRGWLVQAAGASVGRHIRQFERSRWSYFLFHDHSEV
jgi:hypothetical protein